MSTSGTLDALVARDASSAVGAVGIFEEVRNA
jgi:hypothetical protein